MFLVIAALMIAGLETDPEFKKGQDQVEAFEYEKAAATFDAVTKRAGLADADRAVALVWLGLAAAELRDQARASVAFEDAVTADPLIVLPRDASPKIKALFEDARARVRLRPKPEKDVAAPFVADHGGATNGTINTGIKGADVSGVVPAKPENGMTPIAIGTVVVGGVVAIGGGVVWGLGLALRQQAVNAPFQSDAATLRDQSYACQIGGQVATGVGVAAVAAGAVLFAVTAFE